MWRERDRTLFRVFIFAGGALCLFYAIIFRPITFEGQGDYPAYLDLARLIHAHADDPAIKGFDETVRGRTGMGGGICLRLGVDLARQGRMELAATALDAAVARFCGHALDLTLLRDSLVK